MKRFEYIERLFTDVDPLSVEIDNQGRRTLGAQPSIGPDVARLLQMLILQSNAQRVLELGTGLGYGSICLGRTLKETGGRLLTFENDAERSELARQNIARAGLTDVVELVCSDVTVELKQLTGPFDLILQDSAKPLYTEMLDDCVRLLRPGGWLAADDTLFPALDVPEHLGIAVDRYNKAVLADLRLASTLLPIGDGLMLSLKRG